MMSALLFVAERAQGETFREFVSRVGAQEIGKAGFAVVDSVI